LEQVVDVSILLPIVFAKLVQVTDCAIKHALNLEQMEFLNKKKSDIFVFKDFEIRQAYSRYHMINGMLPKNKFQTFLN
jgi:hypothetical protein